MKIVASKWDIIWNYIGTLFSLSSSFILLPFVLIFLSPSELGLWYVFLAVNGLVSMFDFGFDPTFARNIAYAWSGADEITRTGAKFDKLHRNPNFGLLKLLINSSKLMYFIISVVALILLSTVGTLYISYISKGLSGSEHFIAWGIFCASIFLNLYMGYFSAMLRGVGAISIINKATIISKLIQLLASIIMLVLGLKLIAVAVGFFLNGVILRFICNYGFMKYKSIGKSLNKVEKKYSITQYFSMLKTISYNASRDGIVAISNYLTTQSSSLIASMFLTLAQTGSYSIALQFANAVSNVSAAMINAYHPTLQSAYLRKNRQVETEIISRGISVYYILNIVGTLGVAIVILPLISIVKPGVTINIALFLVLSLYIFLWQQQSVNASYISNTNVVPYVRAFVLSSIGGVILSLLLINFTNLNVWSVVIGPAVVQLMYNNWKWPQYVARYLNLRYYQIIYNGLLIWIGDIKAKFKK